MDKLSKLNDRIPGRKIRLNQKTLVPGKKGYASVVLLGDVHLGSPQCEEEKFRRMVEYCLDNKLYVLLMGDLLECSTRESIGAGVYLQVENPHSQYERMVEFIRPLANEGLILGSLEGNHENRIFKLSGVNVMKAFCRELHIPYLGTACWNLFRVGSTNYRVYSLHGSSGSRYEHTKLKAITDISHNFDADVICMGHVHTCADTAQIVQEVNLRNKTIKERKKFLIITGHYLSYDGSYAQTKGMPIGKMGSPKVQLYADHRDVHVSW